jgi:hypothetical protein
LRLSVAFSAPDGPKRCDALGMNLPGAAKRTLERRKRLLGIAQPSTRPSARQASADSADTSAP